MTSFQGASGNLSHAMQFRFLLEYTQTQDLTLGFWGQAADLAFCIKNDVKPPPEALQQLASFIRAGMGEAAPQEPSSEAAVGSKEGSAAAFPHEKVAFAAANSEPLQQRMESAGNAVSQPVVSAWGGSAARPAATAPPPGQQQQPTDMAAAWRSPASLLASVIPGPQPGPQPPTPMMLPPQPAVTIKQEAAVELQVGRLRRAAEVRRYSRASLTQIESELQSKGCRPSADIQQAIRSHALARTQITGVGSDEQEAPPPAATQAGPPEQANGSPISTAWNPKEEREWSSRVAKRQMRFAGDVQQQQLPAEQGEIPSAATPTAAAKPAAPSAPAPPGDASGTSQAAAAGKPAASLAVAGARPGATPERAAAAHSSAGARAAAQAPAAPGRSQPADSAAARPEHRRPEAQEAPVAPHPEASLEEGELVASPDVASAPAGGRLARPAACLPGRRQLPLQRLSSLPPTSGSRCFPAQHCDEHAWAVPWASYGIVQMHERKRVAPAEGGSTQADAQPPLAPRPSDPAPADTTSSQSAQEPMFTFFPPKTLKLGPAAAVPTQEHGPALVYQFGGGGGQHGTDPGTGVQPMASAHQAKLAAAQGTRPEVLACSGVAGRIALAAGPGQAARRGDSAALPGGAAAAAAEQQMGAGPGQQAAAVSAAAQLAGPGTMSTGDSQKLACLPAGGGLGAQAGSAQQSGPLPNGSDPSAEWQGQQSGPLPSGSAPLAGLQGQGVPASFSAAAPAASTVFGQGSARVSFKTLSEAASFSVLHVMQALERFCTQGWPNPVMLNATMPDEVQQVCPGHNRDLSAPCGRFSFFCM